MRQYLKGAIAASRYRFLKNLHLAKPRSASSYLSSNPVKPSNHFESLSLMGLPLLSELAL